MTVATPCASEESMRARRGASAMRSTSIFSMVACRPLPGGCLDMAGRRTTILSPGWTDLGPTLGGGYFKAQFLYLACNSGSCEIRKGGMKSAGFWISAFHISAFIRFFPSSRLRCSSNVEVGTPVARRPPNRSPRTICPHRDTQAPRATMDESDSLCGFGTFFLSLNSPTRLALSSGMSVLTDSARSAVLRDGQIVLTLESGSELRFPVAANPRLAHGTAEQLSQMEVSPYPDPRSQLAGR